MKVNEIYDQIKDYKLLEKESDKKGMNKMCYIKYINKYSKELNKGGYLYKKSKDYIVLQAYNGKFRWSVQLKDNIIFYKNK